LKDTFIACKAGMQPIQGDEFGLGRLAEQFPQVDARVRLPEYGLGDASGIVVVEHDLSQSKERNGSDPLLDERGGSHPYPAGLRLTGGKVAQHEQVLFRLFRADKRLAR